MKTFRQVCHVITLLLLSGILFSCTESANQYVIETEAGNITFEVYPDKAPITVTNFKRYIDQNIFEGAFFYRVVTMDNQPNNDVKIQVIQGDFTGKEHYFPTIEHETTAVTGLKHLDGTVSMGRFEVGSTAAEFFICIEDQPELDFEGKRNPDGQGFAAFGQVTEGMDVVKKIQLGAVDKQSLIKPIKINKIRLL